MDELPESAAVIGAGAWGTTLANHLAPRAATVLWAREPEVCADVNRHHRNSTFLPGAELHPDLRASDSLEEAVGGAELVVMAVPSAHFRAVAAAALPHVTGERPIISVTKGLEPGSLRRMTEILSDLRPDCPRGVLTGPNLAREIADGQPTATVIACADEGWAGRLQALFGGPALRVYTNPDVVGCELGGALKNVVAVAAGLCDGLGLGGNARGVLITRGLAEMTRLGVALGAHPQTFLGLTGLGDLVATCTSERSRNHALGVAVARGASLADVETQAVTVAEGAGCAVVTVELGRRLGVDVATARAVVDVLYHGADPATVLSDLLGLAKRLTSV